MDFEASSLGKKSYPIEVAWVFEDGRAEDWLIRPAADWLDWDTEAEAVHKISRSRLEAEGTPVTEVAQRMLAVLSGHELHASAPSWDGKWLSALLRGAGLPRHAIRLTDTELAHAAAARAILAGAMPEEQLEGEVAGLVGLARDRAALEPVAHRALADAQRERHTFLDVRRMAEERLAALLARSRRA